MNTYQSRSNILLIGMSISELADEQKNLFKDVFCLDPKITDSELQKKRLILLAQRMYVMYTVPKTPVRDEIINRCTKAMIREYAAGGAVDDEEFMDNLHSVLHLMDEMRQKRRQSEDATEVRKKIRNDLDILLGKK